MLPGNLKIFAYSEGFSIRYCLQQQQKKIHIFRLQDGFLYITI